MNKFTDNLLDKITNNLNAHPELIASSLSHKHKLSNHDAVFDRPLCLTVPNTVLMMENTSLTDPVEQVTDVALLDKWDGCEDLRYIMNCVEASCVSTYGQRDIYIFNLVKSTSSVRVWTERPHFNFFYDLRTAVTIYLEYERFLGELEHFGYWDVSQQQIFDVDNKDLFFDDNLYSKAEALNTKITCDVIISKYLYDASIAHRAQMWEWVSVSTAAALGLYASGWITYPQIVQWMHSGKTSVKQICHDLAKSAASGAAIGIHEHTSNAISSGVNSLLDTIRHYHKLATDQLKSMVGETAYNSLAKLVGIITMIYLVYVLVKLLDLTNDIVATVANSFVEIIPSPTTFIKVIRKLRTPEKVVNAQADSVVGAAAVILIGASAMFMGVNMKDLRSVSTFVSSLNSGVRISETVADNLQKTVEWIAYNIAPHSYYGKKAKINKRFHWLLEHISNFSSVTDLGKVLRKKPAKLNKLQKVLAKYDKWETRMLLSKSLKTESAALAVMRYRVSVLKIAASKATNAGATRMVPVPLMMFGKSNQGKSTAMHYITKLLVSKLKKNGHMPDLDPDSKDHMYTKPQSSDYYTDYNDNLVMVLDDVFQLTDSMSLARECGQLINFVNSVTCPLDMASVEDKGKFYMKSPFLFMTTNRTVFTSLPVIEPEAIARRMGFAVEVMRKSDLTDPTQKSQLTNAWEFKVRYNIGQAPSGLNVSNYWSESNKYLNHNYCDGDILNIHQLTQLLYERYEHNRNQYTVMAQMMEEHDSSSSSNSLDDDDLLILESDEEYPQEASLYVEEASDNDSVCNSGDCVVSNNLHQKFPSIWQRLSESKYITPQDLRHKLPYFSSQYVVAPTGDIKFVERMLRTICEEGYTRQRLVDICSNRFAWNALVVKVCLQYPWFTRCEHYLNYGDEDMSKHSMNSWSFDYNDNDFDYDHVDEKLCTNLLSDILKDTKSNDLEIFFRRINHDGKFASNKVYYPVTDDLKTWLLLFYTFNGPHPLFDFYFVAGHLGVYHFITPTKPNNAPYGPIEVPRPLQGWKAFPFPSNHRIRNVLYLKTRIQYGLKTTLLVAAGYAAAIYFAVKVMSSVVSKSSNTVDEEVEGDSAVPNGKRNRPNRQRRNIRYQNRLKVEAQGMSDISSIGKIYGNYRSVTVIYTGKRKIYVHGMFLDQCHFAISRHALLWDNGNFDLVLHDVANPADGDSGYQFRCGEFYVYQPDPNRDLAIVKFHKAIPAVKSIIGMLPTTCEVPKGQVRRLLRVNNGDSTVNFAEGPFSLAGELVSKTNYKTAAGSARLPATRYWVAVDGGGEPGDCGFAYIIDNKAFTLLGIHGGRYGNDSTIIPICRGDVLVSAQSLAEDTLCETVQYLADGETVAGARFVGKYLGPSNNGPPTSSLQVVATKLRQEFTNALYPAGISAKYQKNRFGSTINFGVTRFSLPELEYDDIIQEFVSPHRLFEVDNMRTALFGDTGSAYPSMATSSKFVGWPFRLKKSELVNFADKYVHPVLEFWLIKLLNHAKTHRITALVNIFGKDELLDLSKILEKVECRNICGHAFIVNIALRMYFGRFIDWVIKHPALSPMCIGVDPCTDEWRHLCSTIHRHPNLAMGDLSKEEAITNEEMKELFWDMISSHYDYDDEQTTIAHNLLGVLSGYYFIWNGSVYHTSRGHPSGSLLTFFYNSFVVWLLMRICFDSLRPSDEKFSEHVAFKSGGDDSAFSVSDAVADWYNMQSIARFLHEEMGITYTSPIKGAVLPKFVAFGDPMHTFLGRSFDIQEDKVVATLRMSAIEGMLVYWRPVPGMLKEDVIKDRVESAIKELALYPKHVYEGYRARYNRAMTGNRYKIKFPPYSAAREYFESRYYTNDMVIAQSAFEPPNITARIEHLQDEDLDADKTELTEVDKTEEVMTSTMHIGRMVPDPYPNKTPVHILSRKYLIHKVNFGVSTVNGSAGDKFVFNPVSDLLSISTIQDYLKVFGMFRAGVELDIVLLSNSMQYGAMGVSYLPYMNAVDSRLLELWQLSQSSMDVLSISQQNSIKITLPYLRPEEFYKVNATDPLAWRVVLNRFFLSSITSGTALNFSVQVFANFTDLHAAGYVQAQSSITPFNRDLTLAAASAGTMVASMGAQALMTGGTSIAKDMMVGAAKYAASSLWDWTVSQPAELQDDAQPVEATKPMNLNLLGDVAAPAIIPSGSIQRLGDFTKFECGALTRLNTTTNLAQLCGIPVWLSNYQLSQPTDEIVLDVTPLPVNSHAEYISRAFRYYRGSSRVLLKFFCSQIVSARVKIILFPLGTGIDDDSAIGDLPSWIVSIKGEQSFSLEIPYLQETPWLQPGDGYVPQLRLQLLDALPQPYDTPPEIFVMYFAAAAPDIEFASLQSVRPAAQCLIADMASPERIGDIMPSKYQGGIRDIAEILGRYSTRDIADFKPFPILLTATNYADLDNFDYFSSIYGFYTGETNMKITFSAAPANGLVQATIGNTRNSAVGDTFSGGNGLILNHQAVWPALQFQFPYFQENSFNSTYNENSFFGPQLSEGGTISSVLIAASPTFLLSYVFPVPLPQSAFNYPVVEAQSGNTKLYRKFGTTYPLSFELTNSSANTLDIRCELYRVSGNIDALFGIFFTPDPLPPNTILPVQASFSGYAGSFMSWKDIYGNGLQVVRDKWNLQKDYSNPIYCHIISTTTSPLAANFAFEITVSSRNDRYLIAADALNPIYVNSANSLSVTNTITNPLYTEVNNDVNTVLTGQPISVVTDVSSPLTITGQVEGLADPTNPIWTTSFH